MSGGIELLLTDGVIDALVNELSEASCRDLLRRLLRERLESVGTPPAEELPGPGERVQIILNAVRGPLGDRWIVDEPSYRRLIDDGAVAAWRRPVVGEKVKLTLAPMPAAAREEGVA